MKHEENDYKEHVIVCGRTILWAPKPLIKLSHQCSINVHFLEYIPLKVDNYLIRHRLSENQWEIYHRPIAATMALSFSALYLPLNYLLEGLLFTGQKQCVFQANVNYYQANGCCDLIAPRHDIEIKQPHHAPGRADKTSRPQSWCTSRVCGKISLAITNRWGSIDPTVPSLMNSPTWHANGQLIHCMAFMQHDALKTTVKVFLILNRKRSIKTSTGVP